MGKRVVFLTVAALAVLVAMPLVAGGKSEAGGAKAPVTLSVMTEMNTGITTPGVQDDQVAKWLEQKTGIVLSIENVEGTTILEKVLAANAAGDLPDVFVYDSDAKTFKTLLDSGSLLDLTPYESKLTNWKKNAFLTKVLGFAKQFLSAGTGKLLNLPMSNGLNGSPAALTCGAFIRWDYYKELGYPKVTGIMDLLPVLKQIQDRHPQTKEGKPAYGVSFWSDWGVWPVTVFGFVDGFAEGVGYYGVVDISTEELVPLIRDDSIFWKYIQFYNKAYQMGILDPDSFTIKQEQWSEKVVAGQVYFMIPGWMTNAYRGDPSEGYALIDTTGSSDKMYAAWANLAGNPYVISSKTKKADAAISLFNWLADESVMKTILNGVQGQTWDLVGGKAAYKPGIIDILDDANNPERLKYGLKYTHLSALAGGMIDAAGLSLNFRYYPEFIAQSLTAMEKDQAKYYGVTLPSDIYTRKKHTQYYNEVMAAYPASEDQDYVQRDANISAYFEENWFQLVRAPDDAAFAAAKAKFVADLKAMGWDTQIAQVIKTFNDTRTKIRGK